MSISVETLALAKKNTKQAVEEAVTSVYRYKGSVETFEDLPTSGQKVGDVYNVEKEAGRNYAWDGSDWDALGIAENLGDIEFTGADSEIKTINEDFWDKDKVQEELDDVSNDLSNTSNALNNSINEVSNVANSAYSNAVNYTNNSINTLSNDLGNVEFYETENIVHFPGTINHPIDLNNLSNDDVIEVYLSAEDRSNVSNLMSNGSYSEGPFFIPYGSNSISADADIHMLGGKPLDYWNQYFKLDLTKEKHVFTKSTFLQLNPVYRYLYFKNTFDAIRQGKQAYQSVSNFNFSKESYIKYKSYNTKTINNDFYDKQDVNNITNNVKDDITNNLGNYNFTITETMQDYNVPASIRVNEIAYTGETSGSYLNMTQGLKLSNINLIENPTNYYLGTVTMDNFNEIKALAQANNGLLYSSVPGYEEGCTAEDSHIFKKSMALGYRLNEQQNCFDMMVTKKFIDEYIPNYNISYITFINGVVNTTNSANMHWYTMENPVYHIQYKQPVTHNINNNYYDKDATNSLANDTLNAAKAYTDSKFDISLKKEVVQELPAEGEEDILYLVPKVDAETEDIYDEYIWTNNAWEKIGSTATDLSGYYTSNEVDNIVSNVNNDVSNVSNATSSASNTANNALNIATAASNSLNDLGNVEFNYYTMADEIATLDGSNENDLVDFIYTKENGKKIQFFKPIKIDQLKTFELDGYEGKVIIDSDDLALILDNTIFGLSNSISEIAEVISLSYQQEEQGLMDFYYIFNDINIENYTYLFIPYKMSSRNPNILAPLWGAQALVKFNHLGESQKDVTINNDFLDKNAIQVINNDMNSQTNSMITNVYSAVNNVGNTANNAYNTANNACNIANNAYNIANNAYNIANNANNYVDNVCSNSNLYYERQVHLSSEGATYLISDNKQELKTYNYIDFTESTGHMVKIVKNDGTNTSYLVPNDKTNFEINGDEIRFFICQPPTGSNTGVDFKYKAIKNINIEDKVDKIETVDWILVHKQGSTENINVENYSQFIGVRTENFIDRANSTMLELYNKNNEKIKTVNIIDTDEEEKPVFMPIDITDATTIKLVNSSSGYSLYYKLSNNIVREQENANRFKQVQNDISNVSNQATCAEALARSAGNAAQNATNTANDAYNAISDLGNIEFEILRGEEVFVEHNLANFSMNDLSFNRLTTKGMCLKPDIEYYGPYVKKQYNSLKGIVEQPCYFTYDCESIIFDKMSIGETISLTPSRGIAEDNMDIDGENAVEAEKIADNKIKVSLIVSSDWYTYAGVGLTDYYDDDTEEYVPLFSDFSKVIVSYCSHRVEEWTEPVTITRTLKNDYFDKNATMEAIDGLTNDMREDIANLNNVKERKGVDFELIESFTTNVATNSINIPIDKKYSEYIITFNRPAKRSGSTVQNAFTNENPVFSAQLGSAYLFSSNNGVQTLDTYQTMEAYYIIKNIVYDDYLVTAHSKNNLKTDFAEDYKEDIIEIKDIKTYGLTLNTLNETIEPGIKVKVYGKGDLSIYVE